MTNRLRDWRQWAFALCVAFAAGAPPVAARERIALCVEAADVRPWRTKDGQGLNFILLDRVAKKLGVVIEYRTMTWPRCLAQLKAGEVDGAIAASYKADRAEYGAYPGGTPPDAEKRLHMDRYVVLRKKGATADWDGAQFRNLQGRVGIQLGYSVGEQLRNLGVVIDDGAPNAEALLQKLIADRVPLAAMLEGEVRALLATDKAVAARVEVLPAPLSEKPYFLLLAHRLAKEEGAFAHAIWSTIESERRGAAYRRAEREAFGLEPKR